MNNFEYFVRIGNQMHEADAAYAQGERPDSAIKIQSAQVLTPAECKRLTDQLIKHGTRDGLVTSPAGTAVIDPARYAAKETLFDPTGNKFAWLMRRLAPCIAEAGQLFGLPDLKLVEAARMVSYGKGDHFNWHPDSSAQVPRRLTLSMQLTPDVSYSGGDLMMLGEGSDWACADRAQGGACLFPAALFHRVTPIQQGRRLALVLWFY